MKYWYMLQHRWTLKYSEKSLTKDHILHDPMYMKCTEQLLTRELERQLVATWFKVEVSRISS